MLYELAWVYVRLGDYQRAQRALEVLSITDPESLQFADGSLLRADLMLRSGQFEKALDPVSQRAEPLRPDPRAGDRVPRRHHAIRPSTTTSWSRRARDVGDGGDLSPDRDPVGARRSRERSRLFAMIDDVTASRDLIKRSHRLVMKLNAVLGAPTRIKAFPEIMAAMEQALAS